MYVDGLNLTRSSIFTIAADAEESFAITHLGDELAVAYIDAAAPSPSLSIRILNASGEDDGAVSLDLADQSLNTERISLLGNGSSLLLAWASSQSAADRARVSVARFSCAGQ
jgi:hypothetical protein